MDAHLLAKLPDAVKLGILRHLGAAPVSQQAPQPEDAPLQGAWRPPAQRHQPENRQLTPVVTLAANTSGVPALLANRRLDGGLAVIGSFLDEPDVKAAREEARRVLAEHARDAGMVFTAASAHSNGAGATSTGGQGRTWVHGGTRGDQAAWLSQAALVDSGHERLAAAVGALLSLQPWLAGQGLDVGGRPSVQLACYPGGGARYVRHRDASASVPYRTVTAILYLNPGWEASHGGALCVYNHSTAGTDPSAASPADLRLANSGTTMGAGAGTSGIGGEDGSSRAAGQEVRPSQAGDEQAQHAQRQAGEGPPLASGLDEGHPATVVPPLGGRLVLMDSRLLHEVLPAQAERLALTVWFSRAPPQQAQQAQRDQRERAAQGGADAAAAAAAGGAPQDVQQQQQQQQQQPLRGLPMGAARITAPGHIFVSVPAYRDSEAQWTMADLFAKADCPERVRVGVVWQVQLPEDAPLMRLAGDQRWLGQVRQVVLPASEARGPCKARALAQQLREGEEFYLQIDSHMRFVPGWDTALLRMLGQAECAAGHPRVVLSTYPPGYEGEGPDAVLPAAPLPTVLCASHWGDADGLLRIQGRKLREPLAAPAPALFWAAGLSFSRAQFLAEVPYPRDLPWLFFGEELLQLQRMWRAGWDVFTPCSCVAFHLWSRKHRPTFHRHVDEQQRQESQQRVAAELAGKGAGVQSVGSAPSDAHGGASGGGRDGVGRGGQHRSLQQFWDHIGVDFRPGSKAISERARDGGQPANAFLASA